MNLVRTILGPLRKFQKMIKRDIKDDDKSILQEYFRNGQIPWSPGYEKHKKNSIIAAINNDELIQKISKIGASEKFGYRLDERIVEYTWIFEKIKTGGSKLLDAGSTFNFDFILDHPYIKEKELTIFTFAPEKTNYNEKRISYVYGDLRELPFKDSFFDIVVSQSTIEHIDMDNSIYGYNIDFNKDEKRKSYQYLLAVRELIRVVKQGGTLLITFPYGKFENHGFFQQFDSEMLEKLLDEFYSIGSYSTIFFKYIKEGWTSCSQSECDELVSYNPHTNKGKGEDGAAHCRSICCVKFNKQ